MIKYSVFRLIIKIGTNAMEQEKIATFLVSSFFKHLFQFLNWLRSLETWIRIRYIDTWNRIKLSLNID